MSDTCYDETLGRLLDFHTRSEAAIFIHGLHVEFYNDRINYEIMYSALR